MTEQTGNEERMIAEGKIFAVLAYLSILCLIPVIYYSTLRMIPLVSRKVNRFAIFHAKQGFVIFLLEVAFLAANIIPVLGQIVFTMGALLLFSLSLVGIFQVLRGNYWKCPIVNDWAEKFRI